MFYQKPCTLNSEKSCKALDIKSISVFQQTLIKELLIIVNKYEFKERKLKLKEFIISIVYTIN
jgi:hypothetical protein